jgi:hypothetical protein
MWVRHFVSEIKVGTQTEGAWEQGIEENIWIKERDEMTGGWRELHNEELHNLHFSPSIIRMMKSRRMRRAWHVARMGEKRNAYRILMRKPEGKRPLGRRRRKWVYDVKMDLKERGWYGLDRSG